MELQRNSLLLVDDDKPVRSMLTDIFTRAGYDLAVADSADGALKLLEKRNTDLVLLDIGLPDHSGIDLLAVISSRYPDVACIVLTDSAEIDQAVELLRAGAHDYVSKPFDQGALIRRIEDALGKRQKALDDKEYLEELERLVKDRTEAMEEALFRLRRGYDDTILALGAALDLRDTETEDHCVRVASYAVRLAHAVGIHDDKIIRELRWGAYLHDIGKIGVPDAILLKPGVLTDEEYSVIKRHPELGYRMLSRIPFLTGAADIVRYHHEHFDGDGYPFGLAGDEIPRTARIFSVADAIDAMTSDRPYSRALNWESVYAELRSKAGSQFDPEVVRVFLTIPVSEWMQIRDVHDITAMRTTRPADGRRACDSSLGGPRHTAPLTGTGSASLPCVLFVDDEETSADLGEISLERIGYSVVARTDGESAYELFRTEPMRFSAVVTDHIMPRITGHELGLRVRRIRPDIPVIIATGAYGEYSRDRAEAAGFCFLSKPYTLDQLKTALATCK